MSIVKEFINYVEHELYYTTYFIDEYNVILIHPQDWDNWYWQKSQYNNSKSSIFNMKECKLYSSTELLDGRMPINFDPNSFEHTTLQTYLEILKEK